MKPMGTEQPRWPEQPSRAVWRPLDAAQNLTACRPRPFVKVRLGMARGRRTGAYSAMTRNPDNLTNGAGNESEPSRPPTIFFLHSTQTLKPTPLYPFSFPASIEITLVRSW
ncbi:hypothetical protein CGRA01v4_10532 [Colletotrichum graminicola]|nr:hypothetical protein CGRA01v4_10532 [Colletotrichum graminicola]